MKGSRVTLDPVANGVIVTVGCQAFVFESISQATSEIARYLTNPAEVEAEYGKRYGFIAAQTEPIRGYAQGIDDIESAPRAVNQYIETGLAAGRAIGRR